MPEQNANPAGHTIAIVSRNQLTRLGLQSFIAQDRKLRLVGQAASGEEAEALVARAAPQILLLEPDAALETGDCIQAMRAILPAIRIIVLCSARDKDYTVANHSPAIDGVVLTNEPLTALLAAIRTILPGHRPETWDSHSERISPLQQDQTAGLSDDNTVPVNAAKVLTKRESDVLALLGEGLTNKDIARRLFICPTTVRHHLSHMFNKLDVNSRQQLLVRAQQQGLLQFQGNG